MTSSTSSHTGSSEVKDVFADFGEQAVKSMQHHQYEGDGTKKLFGLFEMDSMIVSITDKFWPIIADRFNSVYARKTYEIVQSQGGRFLHGSTLNRTAAGVTLAANVAVTALPRIGQLVNDLGAQRRQQREIVRKISPELDAIKGKHSVAAYHGVRKTDNEVIYAYRRRINKEHHTSNLWNLIAMGVVTGPNLWSQRIFAKGLHEGTLIPETELQKAAEAASDEKGATFGAIFGAGGGNAVANVGIASVVDSIRDSKIKHIQKTRDKHCALEMIVELAQQTDATPEAHGFRMPGGSEMTLEKAILTIAQQHQKDMSAIDPEYTVLRGALDEDLKNAIKPIAEAIRKGEVSALSLIRLVGEGTLIKNKGRGIAEPEAVQDALSKLAGKTRQEFDTDLKEYFADKTFTEKDAVKILKSYEGDERIMFGAMLPDAIAEHAGLSESEREEIHRYRASQVNEAVSGMVLHLNGKTDEELKQQNLGSADVRHLREAAEKIQKDGDDATRKLRSGPGNTKGVDAIILNWAMPQIVGDKMHFGALVQASREEAAEAAHTPPEHHSGHVAKHLNRAANANHGHEDNDNDHGYAAREDHKRAAGHDMDREF